MLHHFLWKHFNDFLLPLGLGRKSFLWLIRPFLVVITWPSLQSYLTQLPSWLPILSILLFFCSSKVLLSPFALSQIYPLVLSSILCLVTALYLLQMTSHILPLWSPNLAQIPYDILLYNHTLFVMIPLVCECVINAYFSLDCKGPWKWQLGMFLLSLVAHVSFTVLDAWRCSINVYWMSVVEWMTVYCVRNTVERIISFELIQTEKSW